MKNLAFYLILFSTALFMFGSTSYACCGDDVRIKVIQDCDCVMISNNPECSGVYQIQYEWFCEEYSPGCPDNKPYCDNVGPTREVTLSRSWKCETGENQTDCSGDHSGCNTPTLTSEIKGDRNKCECDEDA